MRQPISARVSRAKGTTRIEFYLARAYKKYANAFARTRRSATESVIIDPKTPREYPPGKL